LKEGVVENMITIFNANYC